MSNPIIYEKQNLGHIQQIQGRNKEGELELALVFENPTSAAIFLKLESNEMLDVGPTLMRVEQFKGMYFPRIIKIYSSKRDYDQEKSDELDKSNG